MQFTAVTVTLLWLLLLFWAILSGYSVTGYFYFLGLLLANASSNLVVTSNIPLLLLLLLFTK